MPDGWIVVRLDHPKGPIMYGVWPDYSRALSFASNIHAHETENVYLEQWHKGKCIKTIL